MPSDPQNFARSRRFAKQNGGSDVVVEQDAAGQRFVATVNGQEAVLRYRRTGDTLDFYQTYVPETLRGQGLAEQLCKAAFEYAKTHQLRVIPTCSYISGAYLKRHPEYVPLTTS